MFDKDKQEPKAPEPAQAPAPPSVPESDFQLLAKIMLQREARLAQKEQIEENARVARETKRQQNAESHYNDANETQSRCRHLKGGKNRVITQNEDYAIYIHTYINAERVIKCTLCGAKWKVRDTKEFLFRYGKKVPNHTRIGWEEACQMLAHTSNKPSSSEIPYSAPQATTAES